VEICVADGRAQESVEYEQSLGYRVLVIRQFRNVHPAQAHYEVDAVVLYEALLLEVLPTVEGRRDSYRITVLQEKILWKNDAPSAGGVTVAILNTSISLVLLARLSRAG
jgi:hypothetical protein